MALRAEVAIVVLDFCINPQGKSIQGPALLHTSRGQWIADGALQHLLALLGTQPIIDIN